MVVSMEIRIATAADVDALAVLKQLWSPPAQPPTEASREEFATTLGTWMQANNATCMVADLDGELVGMAWLIVFERVPNPDARRRLGGDIQSVYVIAEHRGQGVGRRLVQALCALADERGVARVTVHSGTRTTGFYERLGFQHSGVLLQRER